MPPTLFFSYLNHQSLNLPIWKFCGEFSQFSWWYVSTIISIQSWKCKLCSGHHLRLKCFFCFNIQQSCVGVWLKSNFHIPYECRSAIFSPPLKQGTGLMLFFSWIIVFTLNIWKVFKVWLSFYKYWGWKHRTIINYLPLFSTKVSYKFDFKIKSSNLHLFNAFGLWTFFSFISITLKCCPASMPWKMIQMPFQRVWVIALFSICPILQI